MTDEKKQLYFVDSLHANELREGLLVSLFYIVIEDMVKCNSDN
jgi:hypothetical protein